MKNLRLIWILWPSFLVAAVANALFFTIFDPHDLVAFGEPLRMGRIAIYSIGFFALWAVVAAGNAMSCYLQRTAAQVNQCPFDPERRPGGCPGNGEERCE